jgi:hypothetical protein
MCGAEQELQTYPNARETNYVQMRGMIYKLDKGLSIEALCPECAGIVGQFIMSKRKDKVLAKAGKIKENRVSTMR